MTKLIEEARAHGMMVVYNLTGTGLVDDMVDPALAPRAGEFMIKGSGGADKFVNSNLDTALKERGIRTVIVTGTSAQGAVAGTTNGAAQRGYKAVVPVDGCRRRMPSTNSTRSGISARVDPSTSPATPR